VQCDDARLGALEERAPPLARLLEFGGALPLALGDGGERVALRLQYAIHGCRGRKRGRAARIAVHGREFILRCWQSDAIVMSLQYAESTVGRDRVDT